MKNVFFSCVLLVFATISIFSQLAIVRPIPNQTFKINETIIVEWTGIPLSKEVDIYISSNNGISWELKESKVTGGIYQWVNTNSNAVTYKVMIITEGKEVLKTKIFTGHTHWMNHLDWSPDDSKIVSVSFDQIVKIWDVKSGELIKNLIGHTNNVRFAYWSPDGSKILSVDENGIGIIWDSSGTKLFSLIGHTGSIWHGMWSPNGKYIATGSQDKTVKIWDSNNGNLLNTFYGHRDRIYYLDWSLNSNFVASAGFEGDSYIWDLSNSTIKSYLPGHTDWVRNIEFSPDGSKVVTSSYDKTCKVWDVETGTLLRTLQGHSQGVLFSTWSPDGEEIASSARDHSIIIWNAQSGTIKNRINAHDHIIYHLHWSKLFNLIASCSADLTAKVWSTASPSSYADLIGHTGYVGWVRWANTKKCLASVALDFDVRVWEFVPALDTVISNSFSTEKKIDSGYVLLYPDSRSAYPSTFVEIPIILTDASNLNIAGVTAFDFDLNYNNTLLMPVGFKATVVDPDSSFSSIHFENIPAITGEIARVRCRVGLGNAPSSRLFLTNVVPIGGPSYVATREGIFTLLGICEEGGTRLLNPTGRTGVVALTVNAGWIELELDRAEAGSAQLSLTNQIGQVVYSVNLQHTEQLRSQESISTTNFSSGVYYLTFTTATTTQTVPVMLVK